MTVTASPGVALKQDGCRTATALSWAPIDFVLESPDDRSRVKANLPSGFAFRSRKNGEVELSRHGRVVSVLRGSAAASFLAQVGECTHDQAQHLMARFTGNYKRGNERSAATMNRLSAR